ncbi:MAG TPA: hypothetical protein VFX15_10960 [Actinomycetes bacterium]|nr:hypothetical protein [Actinomycetes bacterium]
MRWLSRRSTPVGRHSVSPARTDPTRTVQQLPVTPEPEPPPPSESGVYLGFADGVVLQLSASDPRAATFRSLARALTQGHT